MTIGMTNAAPAGGGGGGSEEWTELTSGLWSQLIDQDTGKLLYDVMIIPKDYNNTIMSSSSKNVRIKLSSPIFFPKETPNMNTSFEFPVITKVAYWDSGSSEYITGAFIYYGFNYISTNVAIYLNHQGFTIDGDTNTISISNSTNNSGTKTNVNWTSLFKILYR